MADSSAGIHGQWFDPSKLAAAIAAQGKQADGRTVLTGKDLLSILNPIAAPRWEDPSALSGSPFHMERDSGGDYVQVANRPGYFVSSNGTPLESPDGGKTFTDTYDNPTGNGKRDQAKVTYEIRNGQAVPVSATNAYEPSDWVDWGRDATKMLGTVLSAGAAGYAAAAYGAAGAGGTAAAEGGAGLATAAPAYGGVGTAGAGAAGEGAAGSSFLEGVGSGALKGAAINGGTTAARGGSLSDILKSAATGAVTGAVGGAVGSYNPTGAAGISDATLQRVGNGAITSGINAGLTGGNIGTAAWRGALGGATGGVTSGVGGAVTDATGSSLAGQFAAGAAGAGLSSITSRSGGSMPDMTNMENTGGLSSSDRAALYGNEGYGSTAANITDASQVDPSIAARFQQTTGMSVQEAITAGGGALDQLGAMVSAAQEYKTGRSGVAASQAAGAAAAGAAAVQEGQSRNINSTVNQSALPAAGQIGLNALGANYLSADQVNQLQGLQRTIANPNTSAADKAAAQAQVQTLQKTAEAAGIGLESAKADRINSTAQGQATAERGIGETDAQARLANADTSAGVLNATGDARRADQTGFYNTMAQNVQDVAKQRAADFEAKQTTKGNADIETSAGDAQRQLLRLGGDSNKMAAMSADIANNQQLARIGNGNAIGATNIANLNAADDHARALKMSGFNAGTNAQYGLQDQAMSMKSSALDAARASRTSASQVAQGILNTGQNAGVGIVNNAKDKVDGAMGSAQSAAAGMAPGLANASTGASNSTNGAGSVINTGVYAQNTSQGLAGQGIGQGTTAFGKAMNPLVPGLGSIVSKGFGALTGGNFSSPNPGNDGVGTNSTGGAFHDKTYGDDGSGNSGQSYGAAAPPVIGGSTYDFGGDSGFKYDSGSSDFSFSSRTMKHDVEDLGDDQVLDGLAAAKPKAWTYDKGVSDGGRHVGPMAEDMQKQFGDTVAPGGKKIDRTSHLGLQHAAINALTKRVKTLEARK